MTFSPATLRQLGAYWTDHGGVNLGIVGDTSHVTGYHLGRDRIYSPSGQGDADYSVKHPRDKAGLTDAASAIDLGKLNGSYGELYDFSRWLVRQCQRDGAGDIREIIYSPDGSRVERYSGIDNAIHSGPGNGDASHRFHTHISYFRDSESRAKVDAFAPYFEDTDMALDFYPVAGGDGTVTLAEGRGLVTLAGKAVTTTDTVKTAHCRVHLLTPYRDGDGWQDGYLVRHSQQAMIAFDAVVASFVPAAPAEPPPSTSPVVLTGDDGSEYRRVES